MTNPRLGTLKVDVIGGMLLVLLTATLYILVLRPAHQRWVTRESTAQELRAERDISTTLARSLAARQAELHRLRRTLDSFSQPCWVEQDRSRRLEWLFQLARAHGLVVESIEPAEGDRIAGRAVVPLRLTAHGEFESLVHLLGQMRRDMPDVVLRSLELTLSPAETSRLLIMTDLLWVPVSEAGRPAPASSFAPTRSTSPVPATPGGGVQ